MMTTLNLTPHPLALLFPGMSDEEYAALKADVAIRGVIETIILYEGMILDGIHRYRAASETGQTFNTEVFSGTPEEARDYVISLNVNRRHLTVAQKAIVAAGIVTSERGRPSVNPHSMWINQGAAADRFGIHRNSVTLAIKILAEADEDIINAVRNGEWSLQVADDERATRVAEAAAERQRDEERRRQFELAEQRRREEEAKAAAAAANAAEAERLHAIALEEERKRKAAEEEERQRNEAKRKAEAEREATRIAELRRKAEEARLAAEDARRKAAEAARYNTACDALFQTDAQRAVFRRKILQRNFSHERQYNIALQLTANLTNLESLTTISDWIDTYIIQLDKQAELESAKSTILKTVASDVRLALHAVADLNQHLEKIVLQFEAWEYPFDYPIEPAQLEVLATLANLIERLQK